MSSPWRYDVRNYDKAKVVLKKLKLKSKVQDNKTKYNFSETIKSSCPQPKAITEDKHDRQNVSATDSADDLVPNKMYRVVLVDGQLMLAEHDENDENVEHTNESNVEINNSNVDENIIVNTKKKPTVMLNRVDEHYAGPNTPNKPVAKPRVVLKKLNLTSLKLQDLKTQNNSSETVKSCPQPKGIIFNYKIKKRATENKPLTEDKHDNKPVREEFHDNIQNVSATDSADEQNNVSAINDADLVQNKMYKVVLVDGQLMLTEHDEDYIVEENVEQTNESNAEIVDIDNCETNNSEINENVTVNTKKKPPIILNKVLDNNHTSPNTPKDIKSYSVNMDSNENLVQNININGPNNKMYATLDDLADAREGKAMVLLPLEKYTRLKTQLKESQICEETLKREVEKFKIQINGYQMQQEYLLGEEAKLNDQIRVLKLKEEMHLKIIKSKSRVVRHAENQTVPYLEKELKELETLRTFNTKIREIFNEGQIALMMCCPRKVKECPWPDADKEKVIFLRQIISQSAYLFLKNKMNFPLPTLRNIQQWMREKNIPVKTKNKVQMSNLPADNVAAQDIALTQDASAISIQTHDELYAHITILPQDEHIHTIQPQDEHMHTIQLQDEHMHTIQPQDEHMQTIQLQDEHMHTTQYQNEETETTQAINSIVDHQEGIGIYDIMSVPANPGEEFIVYADENLQSDMDSNMYSDYMQNDDIASTEEIVHTEVNHTEVAPTEVTQTEVTPTEVTPTEVTPTEVTHTEVTHPEEVKTKRVVQYIPRCRLCMIPFTTDVEVREHVRSHYQNSWYTTYLDARKPYTCEFCNEMVKNRVHLIYHHRGHLGIEPLKCPFPGCNYSGRTTCSLISHLDRHRPRSFQCEQCPATFRTRKYLLSHRGAHSARRSRRCPLCRAECRTDLTYQQHMLAHDKPPRIRCRALDCPERFYSRLAMRQHYGAAHERLFRCPRCPGGGVSFAFKKQLNKHLQDHETRKVSHCVQCMKVFHDFGEYYAHCDQHKRDKMKCACGDRFADKDKLAEHKLQCTILASVEVKPKKTGRKRKYPEGDPNNIKPKRKRIPKYPEGDPNNIKPKNRRIPKKKQPDTTAKENTAACEKTSVPNIIIHKQEVIKKANVIQFKERAMSPDLQIVVADNDTGRPGKILMLKKVDSLPANFRDKLIPLPPNFQQKVKTNKNMILPSNPEHTDITLSTNPEHTDITLPGNSQHADITLPANPQHTDITLSTNPQHADITLPENPQDTDITLSINPEHTDITLPGNPQHAVITLPTPQHTDISLPSNPEHSDITLPENSQHTDITLSRNPQHADITLSAYPQHTYITLSTNPQHADINLPANPQHTEITLPSNPQNTDITLPENSQHTDITLPTNPQHTDITLSTNPQHTDITLSANPQQDDITLPTNPQHTDITLPTNPQHTDITLPSDLPFNDIIEPKNTQQVSALPAIIMGLSENSPQKNVDLPADSQQKVHFMLANTRQKVTLLPVHSKRRVNLLPGNSQRKVTTLPGNPQRRVTTLPANPQQRSNTPPGNPQQINVAVRANQHDRLISALEDHLIVRPRSVQPNILARSSSHRRHVPVVSVGDKLNETALQKVKTDPASEIPADTFPDRTPKAIISGTKGYYLNKLSVPQGGRTHKIVTLSSRKKIEDTVLKEMSYVSEFVKTLKSESDENVPKIESAIPKLKNVIPIGMKQKKLILQTPRASSHQSVRGIPQHLTSVRGSPQPDMPDLEL